MSYHRVLIVEDHEPTRNILRLILKRKGWATLEAGTVAEGLKFLDGKSRLDCVLLDLDLPDGRGEDLLEQVRADDLPVRVAVLTGSGDGKRWRALERFRPEAVLQKPIEIGDLYQALKG